SALCALAHWGGRSSIPETAEIISIGRDVLDTPPSRSMPTISAATLHALYQPQNAVYPPSITKQSAVWYDDALLMMYTAMPPKSVGSPKRRTGMRGITLATNFSLPMMPAVMSLLIQPGRIAFAVTPWRANSTASARHSAFSAALVPA